MKTIQIYFTAIIIMMSSWSSQAMTVWAVQTGADPFSNSQGTLSLSGGTTTLDIYYDVAGDTSYGYDFILDIVGTGGISNVGGGDSDLGSAYGSGWRQFGGSVYGETGSAVLAFTLDFTGSPGASLYLGGTFTDGNFLDAPITSTLLASVSSVPVPAALWLFTPGLMCLIGVARRGKT